MLEFEDIPMPENLELFEYAYFDCFKFFESMIEKLGLTSQCYTKKHHYEDYLAAQVLRKIISDTKDNNHRILFLNIELKKAIEHGEFNNFIKYYKEDIKDEPTDIKSVWVIYQKLREKYYSKHAGDNNTEKNSLVDFHEDYGYCYSEKSILAYSENRRFM